MKDFNFDGETVVSMLENMTNSVEDIEIIDYTFGNRDSIIHAAAVCKDLKTGLESGVAYQTNVGVGFLLLASDSQDFAYYVDGGVDIDPANTIVLSLINTTVKEIYDYRIEFTRTDKNTSFIIDSSIRNADN